MWVSEPGADDSTWLRTDQYVQNQYPLSFDSSIKRQSVTTNPAVYSTAPRVEPHEGLKWKLYIEISTMIKHVAIIKCWKLQKLIAVREFNVVK